MKKEMTIPLLSLLGGAAALVLRLLQNRTGFEADTGLPIPGAPAGTALLLLLLVLAAAVCLLLLRLPKESDPGPALPGDFPLTSPLLMALLIAGTLLTALSGLADLLEGMGGGSLLLRLRTAADFYGEEAALDVLRLSQGAQLLLGILSLLSAAAMLQAVLACRGRGDGKNLLLLLVPPVSLVVRLVMIYRLDSVNPALSAYCMELLALVFLALAFYRLSSFAFQGGRTRRFALYAAAAVVFSLASLGEGGPHLSSPLLYAGGALYLWGFLVLRLTGPVYIPEQSEI